MNLSKENFKNDQKDDVIKFLERIPIDIFNYLVTFFLNQNDMIKLFTNTSTLTFSNKFKELIKCQIIVCNNIKQEGEQNCYHYHSFCSTHIKKCLYIDNFDNIDNIDNLDNINNINNKDIKFKCKEESRNVINTYFSANAHYCYDHDKKLNESYAIIKLYNDYCTHKELLNKYGSLKLSVESETEYSRSDYYHTYYYTVYDKDKDEEIYYASSRYIEHPYWGHIKDIDINICILPEECNEENLNHHKNIVNINKNVVKCRDNYVKKSLY